VTWGTRPQQQVVRTTLASLGDAAVSPPATIVIGPVAALALEWFRPDRGGASPAPPTPRADARLAPR